MWTTRVGLALLVIACAQPKPAEPISARQGTPVERPRATLPIAGKERVPFEANEARLTPAGRLVIEAVAQRLRADPALALQISGHTDATEPEELSDARAKAVRRQLRTYGIAEDRLLIRAAAATEPRDTNATEAGRATNRRVEFERVTIKVDPFGGRVVVTDSDVEILDQVTFVPGTVKLEPTSYPILDAVAATLHGNASIRRMEVQGHTDERGDDLANLRLSHARAKIVVAYLVAKGIDPARLEAQGYGETQPIDTGHDEAAWAKNRRIAFLILERTP